jgi:hypothetical protein
MQPLLLAGRPGGLQRLDDGRGHALVEHAAEQFLAGRQPGRASQHLDIGAHGTEQRGEPAGRLPAGQHRDPQATPGDGRHHGDVGEGHPPGLGQVGEFPLDARRGGVQVGPDGAGSDAGQPGPEGVHRGLGAVHAQHQLRSLRRLGLAAGLDQAGARADRGVVAADGRARGQQITRDDRTGLPQP